jgi:hypothetical protein
VGFPVCSASSLQPFSLFQRAIDFSIESVNFAGAGEGDEFDAFGVAGFKTHGGAGGNVEAEAARGGAVKGQGLVDFEKMEVRADLDGPVAGIGDFELLGRQAGVGVEPLGVGCGDDLARNHEDK